MMIEKAILDYLSKEMSVPVKMEIPSEPTASFVLIEKTGGGQFNYIRNATIAIQSYAPSMYKAAELNETVKSVMESIIELDEVTKVSLNSDYDYTDTSKKQYRYQAVFDIVHY